MASSKNQLSSRVYEQSLNQLPNPIQTIITNIKVHSLQNGDLLNKYRQEFYLTYFDRNKIQHTVMKIGNKDNLKKQLQLQQFMRLFLGFIQHNENETLFLAMSLRNLFIKIKEMTNNQIGVKFTDFTNYLCDKIATDTNQMVMPLKQVPVEKIVPDISRVREIDINPPIVLMNKQTDQPRIAKQKKKIDKKLKQKKPVSKFIYNSSTGQIIAKGRLSSSIHFYDMQLRKLPMDIIPKTFKDISRQIAILSMDFDQCHQRIGAIINGMGISFWQLGDNLSTQKSIGKPYGDKIYYLKLFKQWITTDKNTIYFWDVREEIVDSKIHYDQSLIVNAVCEINHLRCLCVSYTTIDQKKPIIFYKDHKPIARYQMGAPGCHTLHYNLASQLIVTAGYHNTLEVLQLQNNTYSINLVKQLKSHRSIITCVTDIEATNFILSGDDSGEIRIWELNTMKCIQVVQVAKSISQLYCTGEKLIFSDSRLNIMEMDKFSPISSNDEQIIHDFFNEQNDKHLIITRKSIRIINLQNGRIIKIFVICDQQEQISSALGLSSGIIIGTSKGQIKLFNLQGQLKWQLSSHQAQITQLKYDRRTKFIFSLGNDNKLIIYPYKTILEDGPKKVITFKNKNFNLLALFNQARLMFLGSTEQNQICVWDFQNLKLLTIIQINAPALFMEFNQQFKILMISTVNDQFYFFKVLWKNGHLVYQLIYNGESQFTGDKNTKKINYEQQINEVNTSRNKNEEQPSKRPRMSIKMSNCEDKIHESLEEIRKNAQQDTQKSINIDEKLSRLKKKGITKVSVKTIEFQENIDETETHAPSIKLIKIEKNETTKSDTEKTLGTLKTLRRIENQITTRIEIKQTESSCYLLVGNSKGQISCYDISVLLKEILSNHDVPLKKSDSPVLYRSAKQDYDVEESKKKYELITNENMLRSNKMKKSYFRQVWRETCANKEPISCISFIEMKVTYIAVSMTDGYCKYFDLENGIIAGNLKVSLPLPILWEIDLEKDHYIKKNLYETLVVLDSILTNHGFEMLSKQYKSINVSSFLQSLKSKKDLPSENYIKKNNLKQPLQENKGKSITLLHDQYTIEDLKKSQQQGKISNFDGESSLKSLQVYKRVKLIRQQMMLDVKQRQESQIKSKDGIIRVSSEVLRQKQEIIKLLKPNYFNAIGEYNPASNMSRSMQLGSLQERSHVLLQRVSENKKKLSSHHTQPKQSIEKERKESVTLPIISQIKHQSLENKQYDNTKDHKLSENIKEQNLVDKLVNSLSSGSLGCMVKQKGSIQSALSNSIMSSSFVKTQNGSLVFNIKPRAISPQSSYLHKVSSLRLNDGKQNQRRQKERIKKLQDQSTRQILSQINEKLLKYKRSSFSKMDTQ